MDISLCMIVRDEAELLQDCLSRLMPRVAEIVVVDTGSSDASPEIARDCGARLFEFDWRRDFSAARNFSLKQAKYPWILVIDADERISDSECAHLTSLATGQNRLALTAFSLAQRNYLKGSGHLTWSRSWRPNCHQYSEGIGYSGYIDIPVVRLFPNSPQISFEGCVHEGVESSLAKASLPIVSSGVVLHHYGQVRDPLRMRSKKQAYLQLGLEKLRQNPNSGRAHFELGIQYHELQQYEVAIRHFLAARTLDASFVVADLHVGICYSRLGNFAEARIHLSRARQSFPNSPELDAEIGLIELKTGNIEAASVVFEKTLQNHPDHVASLCYLGAVRSHQGKEEAGRALLHRAIEIDPDHTDAWVNLAIAWSKSRNYQSARTCLERAHQLKPNDPEIVRLLAVSMGQTGQHTKASQLLEQAVNIWPKDDRLRAYWAAALAAEGRRKTALAVFEGIRDKGGQMGRLAWQQIEKLESHTGCAVQFEAEDTRVSSTGIR